MEFCGIKINQSPWNTRVELACYRVIGDKFLIAKPLKFVELPNTYTITEPTFSIDRKEAQELFNALWVMGYRPADGTGNAGHVAALSAHLEDMRTLVFDAPRNINVEKKAGD